MASRQVEDPRALCLLVIGVGVIWFLSMQVAMATVKHYRSSVSSLRVGLAVTPVELLPFLWLPFLLLPAAAGAVPGLGSALAAAARHLRDALPAFPAASWALTLAIVAGLYGLAARRFDRIDSFRLELGARSALLAPHRPKHEVADDDLAADGVLESGFDPRAPTGGG